MKTILMLYVPMIDRRYLNLFGKYKDVDALYILGNDLVCECRRSESDNNAIDPFIVKKIVKAIELFKKVEVLDKKCLPEIQKNGTNIVSVQEEISLAAVKKYFPNHLFSFEKLK